MPDGVETLYSRCVCVTRLTNACFPFSPPSSGHIRIRKALENKANMEDDRVAVLETQLSQAKQIAEEADKKYEEVSFLQSPVVDHGVERRYPAARAPLGRWASAESASCSFAFARAVGISLHS